VRLHIPIQTHPDVRFHCGDAEVHMAAGEAWIFDNWRLHRVENPVDAERIHLVADTSGGASFWIFAGLGDTVPVESHRFDPARDARPLAEQVPLRPVMAPAEVDFLLLDLQSELTAPDDCPPEVLLRYRGLLDAFRRDWRQLYHLFGESPAGAAQYAHLRDSVRAASKEQAERLSMRTNRVSAHMVLEGRVLRPMLAESLARATASAPALLRRIQRPLFIVAAPRSGSTLLFETLAASEQLCTVGGEAHWLVEGQPELRLGAPLIDSNRLDGRHYSDAVAERMAEQIVAQWTDRRGHPLSAQTTLRFLEKTPKNALRVPFFDRVFPDAQFILLWREPHENLSSIMEAWRSGDWKTYNGLPGFEEPWSLILPPGWQTLRGKSLAEIAAFQWESTNRILLDDLQALPQARWTHLNYGAFCANPAASIRRLCEFAGLSFDQGLADRVAGPLPLSRYTQTRPASDKWRSNEAAIAPVLPHIQATWARLRELK
jgi:hypothetical protein